MLYKIEDEWHGDYIWFRNIPELNRKTKIWRISGADMVLGEVKWYAPWRKYCLFPSGNTVFEERCLKDISDFIVDRTLEHKLNRKRDKAL